MRGKDVEGGNEGRGRMRRGERRRREMRRKGKEG